MKEKESEIEDEEVKWVMREMRTEARREVQLGSDERREEKESGGEKGEAVN